MATASCLSSLGGQDLEDRVWGRVSCISFGSSGLHTFELLPEYRRAALNLGGGAVDVIRTRVSAEDDQCDSDDDYSCCMRRAGTK